MESIKYIIQGNYITSVLIFFFYSFLFANDTLEEEIIRKFKAVTIIIFIIMCTEITDYLCSQQDNININNIRYVTTTIGYLLRPVSMILVIKVFQRNDKKQSNIIYIPLVLNALGLIINIFYPLMFRYDGNTYVRKLFGFLPHAVSLVYIIVVLVRLIRRFTRINKNEKIMIIFTGVAVTIAVAIETGFWLYFVLSPVALASCIFYYLYLYTNISKIDSLTGLYNRKTLFSNMNKYLKDSFVIVNIDMNNLKKINDNLGHLAGDKALKEISHIFIDNLMYRCSAYRMGGDEFLIICPKYDVQKVERMMEKILIEIEEKNYSIAYGILFCKEGIHLDEALKQSDDLMYAKKREMKQGNSNKVKSKYIKSMSYILMD